MPAPVFGARARAWARARARALKVHVNERRRAKKHAMYTRMVAAAATFGRKSEISKDKSCEEEEGEDKDEDEDEEGEEDTDEDVLEALVQMSLGPRSPPLSRASTPGLEPEHAFSSPAISAPDSTPATPLTPMFARASLASIRPRRSLRTLSVALVPRSPLSLSFPSSPLSLSFPRALSLPLSARRASTPVHLPRHSIDSTAETEDAHGNAGDPFGAHSGAYYSPGAESDGNAYDLSAWAYRCPCQCVIPRGDRCRCKAGAGGIYGAPAYAASEPQLVRAGANTDREYLRALARARIAQPVSSSSRSRASVHGSGMRPLLLPRKLGLPEVSAGARERKTKSTLDVHGSKETGWDVDLERGVCQEGAEVV
ncbi:hypothetical protein BC834DRAFT_845726 [Gloeopeniophorella convolvens]|nr:hypothetical protein BC834DRAFT_845726 [Gloeopeniophorella convolvens]